MQANPYQQGLTP